MSTQFKLYDLSDAIARVNNMIEEGVEGLEDTLESLDGTFQEKCESIIKLWRSKCAGRDIIKSEIYRLQQRVDKLDRDANWLHGYVEREMTKANVTEIKSPLFGIKLGMTPPRVEVLNKDAIPETYLRLIPAKTEPDKVAIKAAMQEGVNVPGCEIKQDLKLHVR